MEYSLEQAASVMLLCSAIAAGVQRAVRGSGQMNSNGSIPSANGQTVQLVQRVQLDAGTTGMTPTRSG